VVIWLHNAAGLVIPAGCEDVTHRPSETAAALYGGRPVNPYHTGAGLGSVSAGYTAIRCRFWAAIKERPLCVSAQAVLLVASSLSMKFRAMLSQSPDWMISSLSRK